MKVLLVEDDQRLSAVLGVSLRRYGYRVHHVPTCREARQATDYDLMLLDLCMPDGDGIEVCRSIRECSNVPIIILSARGAEHDRIFGLRSGADDYIIKPFSMAELEARIQAVMRRPRDSMNATIVISDLALDLSARTVTRSGRSITLTPKEFALLARLAGGQGKIISREQLLLEIWHDSGKAAARTLDVHITNLRSKLGRPTILETIRGVGYRLCTADSN